MKCIGRVSLVFVLLVSLISCKSIPTSVDFGPLYSSRDVDVSMNDIQQGIKYYIYKNPSSSITNNDSNYTINDLLVYYDSNNMNVYHRYSCYYKLSIEIGDNRYRLTLIPLDCIRDYNSKKIEINKKIARIYKQEFERIDNELYEYVKNKNSVTNN